MTMWTRCIPSIQISWMTTTMNWQRTKRMPWAALYHRPPRTISCWKKKYVATKFTLFPTFHSKLFPISSHLLQITEVLKAGVLSDEINLGALAHNAAEQAEVFVRKVWNASWKVCHYKNLPKWLQDNDFLHSGHRPPLPSFAACFKSVFRIHTETGNIWTHLLGCVAFVGVACYFLTRPTIEIQWQEKLIFGPFFIGAIVCLGFSFAFHTLSCHSENVGKLFSKLDYCGIALLIMGSFVPWLYYGFYCHYNQKLIYLSVVSVLGILSIVVSLWDKFSEPNLRPLRAGVFMSFGLSGIVPAIHYSLIEGWFSQISQASLGWLILMGLLYILGALFYALRVPERWFPGKCDIWVSFDNPCDLTQLAKVT